MISGIRFKVCGLTSLVDAEIADKCGADYLGFNLYPQSPRYVSLAQFRAMASHLPDRRKVVIAVEPTVEQLKAMDEAGFDFFQIHFREATPMATLQKWSEMLGPKRLWLAPKLAPAVDLDPALLPLADYVLVDTFRAESFGGTGETGDWGKFARHREAYPNKHWILAGGLNAENVAAAVRATGAKFIDVNSGVETAPGVKDLAKLQQLVVRLHESRAQ